MDEGREKPFLLRIEMYSIGITIGPLWSKFPGFLQTFMYDIFVFQISEKYITFTPILIIFN